MIDEYYTWIFYGYHSDELSRWSIKPIVVTCESCGEYRSIRQDSYRDLCRSCSIKARFEDPKERETISKTLFGRHLSLKHRDAISEGLKNSDTIKARIGIHLPSRWRNKISDGIKESDAHKIAVERQRGGNDIVNHHMIYDHSDLTKNIMPMTRSMHMRLHRLFQKHKIEIPHINIEKVM